MSDIDRVDVSDPNSSLEVGKNRLTDDIETAQRIADFYAGVLDLDKLESARKSVFETNELLEHLLSCLPPINVFGVRRVSKSWNSVIAASVHLQEKVFLRLGSKPHELWTVDAEHKKGANLCGEYHKELKDTELKFRRIDVPPYPDTRSTVTPVTLNPVLHQRSPARYSNVVKTHYRWQGTEFVDFNGWVDGFQIGEASLWRTYLTNPPCNNTDILMFSLCFGEAPSAEDHTQHECRKPSNDFRQIDCPKEDPLSSHPITATACFLETPYLESGAGLTLGNAVKAALEARGRIICNFSNSIVWDHPDATMYDAIGFLKRILRVDRIPKSPYMRLNMRMYNAGSTPLLIPTVEERIAADANYRPAD